MSTPFNKEELKITLKKSCLAFGAYKTAKKISECKEKLVVLVEFLIETGINDAAYLIADFFMEEGDLAQFGTAFDKVDKELNRKTLIKKDHEALLEGVPLPPKKEKKESLVKKSRPKREIPTENKEGFKYITIEETDKKEQIEYIDTDEAFEGVKQHFLDQKFISIDMLNSGDEISTVTLASDSKIAVFDMMEIKSIKNVHKFLRDILGNDSNHIVAYSFCRDAFFLGRTLFFDPEDMTNVHDIAELYLDEEGKRIQLSQMYVNCKDLAITQYYRKLNWLKRPLTEDMTNFTAINASCKLEIYQHLKEKKMIEDSTLVYEEPEGIRQKLLENAERAKKHAELLATKKQKVKTKTENPRRTNKDRSPRRKQSSKNEKNPRRKRSTRGGYRPRKESGEGYQKARDS